MQTKGRSLKISGAVALSAAALALIAWITPARYYQLMSDNELTRSLRKKLAGYNEQHPGDRIYLHFDKPVYQAGDNIWFSAFIRDAATFRPSGKSDILHVEFLDPKGSVTRTINLIAKNGVAAGDFTLDQEALGGIYKVRAYTAWMKNEGENNVFEKELQVQDIVLPNLKMKLDFERKAFGAGDEVVAKLELNTNENQPLANHKLRFVANIAGKSVVTQSDATDENGLTYLKFKLPADLNSSDGLLNVMIDYNGSTESVSRSIPIVLNKIDLKFFPEGGDLVAGMKSKVAFSAVNERGKPADIEGVVIDAGGREITSFSSYHMGMGAFTLTPAASEHYMVKITKPANIAQQFEIPAALPKGYVLDVVPSAHDLELNVCSSENEELSVIAQVRNKVYYSTVIAAKKGDNKIVFPTTEFPAGIAQITLFDSKGIARAERLSFVNKDQQLKISVSTDKEKYLPREKVRMTVSVTDNRGIPMPADLSLAVVNDQLLSFADDKSGNLLSQMLLEQELNQKVEEPAFYFDDKEQKADVALDYLLMTSGWRHFTWEQLMKDELPAVSFAGEKAILSGTVLDASTGKPLPSAKIKIYNGAEYTTDENGKFIFNKLDLTNPQVLTFNATGYSPQSQAIQMYNQGLAIYLYSNTYYQYYYNAPTPSSASGAAGKGLRRSSVAQAAEDNEGMVDMEMAEIPRPASQRANEQEAISEVLDKSINKEKDAAVNVKVLADNKRDDRFKFAEKKEMAGGSGAAANVAYYYRARQFSAPIYDKDENVETRTDFRNTIYWNPDVQVDRTGKKTLEFYTSDDITSFNATVEGFSPDGMPGRAEKKFFSQLPFAMSVKIPVEVATEDNVSIPLTLKNNTDKPLGGYLTITSPDGLHSVGNIPAVQTIMPGAAKTIYLDYKVLDKIGYGDFTLSFKSCGLGDAFTQKIRIAPKGFPVKAGFSGQDVEKEYSFDMKNVVNGSVRATFTAFPNVCGDLMKGVEGILQEPYGCFEQTSCTAYPNAMVLDYLKSTDSKDNQTLARAKDLLDRGYKRLVTFEASQKGYEWFGANPGHEGLTAYGIMEFVDMKKAGGNVDQSMIDRTANWLLSHKDGHGGFARETHAYHDFGRISEDILNAYIVYALAEAGYTDIKKEFENSYGRALETKDPYMLAMMANAAYSLKDASKADEAMNLLLRSQDKSGSFTGSTHSITYSQGQSLTIETTSLSILAMLKGQKYAAAMNDAVKFLVGTRSGSGVFSSTQGTILALKALTEYAKYSKRTVEAGTIEIIVDGKKVAEKEFKAGDKGAIEIAGLEEYLQKEGNHRMKVRYVGVKNALPYSVAVNWSTSLPESDEACSIGLTTSMMSSVANVGETVRMTATVRNKKNSEVPSAMAIIGIPAGFTVQPWQLKELQEKNVFDYYEMKGNNIAVYYRGMEPGAVKEINLDLKAEMPGVYEAPASSAYLYYTNEYKTWSGMNKVTIRKNS